MNESFVHSFFFLQKIMHWACLRYRFVIGQSDKKINIEKGVSGIDRKGENVLKLTREKLAEMEAVDIRTADISTLTDLRDIEIDPSLPVEKKLEDFAEQTNNVYVNRIGDYIVKVRFQKNGVCIDDKLSEYLRRLSEIYIQDGGIGNKSWN